MLYADYLDYLMDNLTEEELADERIGHALFMGDLLSANAELDWMQ